MKEIHLPVITFKTIGLRLGLDAKVVDGRLLVRKIHPCPSDDRPLWTLRLSSGSSFCRAAVRSGLLTHRQMVHAALRYRLGRSKDDAVIYWQINQIGQIYDGKLMWYGPDCHRLKNRHATWVSYLLRRHYGIAQDTFQPAHCFFGLHLLPGVYPLTVCVVEAEKSAVILSEIYPQYIWLAAGGIGELQVNKFFPLRHHRVVLFPDTDPDRIAYTRWYDAAQDVMHAFFWPKRNPIFVSDLLEKNATASQKSRKIDLLDYWVENIRNSASKPSE